MPEFPWGACACFLTQSRYHLGVSRLENALRRVIERSKLSRYSISKGTGISQGQLSRFLNRQRGLAVDSIERLANYLGLEIKIGLKRRRKAR